MNLFHCAFCVFGYIHVMKNLLIILLFLVLQSCNNEASKPTALEIETIEALQERLRDKLRDIQKFHFDHEFDTSATVGYSDSRVVIEQFELTLKSLENLSGVNINIKDSSQKLLNQFKQNTDSFICESNDSLRLINFQMSNATKNTSENQISLLLYAYKLIDNIYSRRFNCGDGWIQKYQLQASSEKNEIHLGDTFRCLTKMTGTMMDYDFIHVVSEPQQNIFITAIFCDEKRVPIQRINSKFNNAFFEFIPDQPGNYSIKLENQERRASGKINKFETSVEFTVLP